MNAGQQVMHVARLLAKHPAPWTWSPANGDARVIDATGGLVTVVPLGARAGLWEGLVAAVNLASGGLHP